MWNAVITCPTGGEEYDIVAVAEKYFDVSEKCLIVREKGKDWHWHIHGTPLRPTARRKVARELNANHPDRQGDPKCRPCRIGEDKDPRGFDYCMKGGMKAVTKAWNITEEELKEMKERSDAYRADATAGSRKRAAEVDVEGLEYPAAAMKIMRGVLDHSLAEKKMIPMQARQIVLSELYSHECYKADVCKSMLKL